MPDAICGSVFFIWESTSHADDEDFQGVHYLRIPRDEIRCVSATHYAPEDDAHIRVTTVAAAGSVDAFRIPIVPQEDQDINVQFPQRDADTQANILRDLINIAGVDTDVTWQWVDVEGGVVPSSTEDYKQYWKRTDGRPK